MIHRPFVRPLAEEDDGPGESARDPLPGVEDPCAGEDADTPNDALDGGVVIFTARNLVS